MVFMTFSRAVFDSAICEAWAMVQRGDDSCCGGVLKRLDGVGLMAEN
jgi:hypothetical protein